MNRGLLIVLALLYAISTPFFCAHGQGVYVKENTWSNVNPAYGEVSDFIITAEGEKLFGKVIRSYDFNEYSKVEFEYDGVVKSYLPSDISAFGLDNGRFFKSKSLPESTEPVFFQVLFSGKLELDFYKGKYYLDNGAEIEELRSYYQDIPGGAIPKKRLIKHYVSTFKINTAGTCGKELVDLIEKSGEKEQAFIRILTQYHECEGMPYKLHVEKVPFVKFSPTVALGLGSDFTRSSLNSEEINYSFSNSLSYRAFVGLRLHDFRRFPKSSLDLRVGYVFKSSTLDASFSPRHEVLSATQEFEETSIVIPLSYNFSLIKMAKKDIYLGFVMSAWFSSIRNSHIVIDQSKIYGPPETIIYERAVMDIFKYGIKPGFKAGANFPLTNKMTLFSELQVDFLKDFYTFQILYSPVVNLNRTYVSFQVGLEF